MRVLPNAFAREPRLAVWQRPSVRAALEAGTFEVQLSESMTHSIELLHVYRMRGEFLAGYSDRYSEQLRRSTLEFCAALERQPRTFSLALTAIELDNGLSVSIWERADTGDLLGCLVGIDHRKTDSSDSEWERLWGAG